LYYYSDGLYYNFTQVQELYSDTINLAPRKQLWLSFYFKNFDYSFRLGQVAVCRITLIQTDLEK
jgi:hypothetical protein